MPLGQHLIELRKRLFRAALAVVATTVVAFFFTDPVLLLLQAPITEIAENTGRQAELTNTVLTEAFDVKLQIALTLGFVVSSPVWLYQVWAYIVPALKTKEKRYAASFLGVAIPLFFAGCAMAIFIFPHTVTLLTSFAPEQTSSLYRTKDFVDFVTKLVVAIGIGFVLPVFLVFLNFIGAMTFATIMKGWRVAILLICLFAAITTPSSDVITMFLVAIPMIGLYFAAAAVAWWHDRVAAKRADRLAAEYAV